MGLLLRLVPLSALATFGVVAGCLGSIDRNYADATGDGGASDAAVLAPEELPAGAVLSPASVGGTVMGLQGPGLVLRNAGQDDLAVVRAGSFAFKTKLFPKERYDVSVVTQPVLPSQKCAVANGAGEAAGVDVTNVEVVCITDAYKVGGNVVGLAGTGLVLQNNGGDDLVVNDGSFQFVAPVPSSSNYDVTIKTQPSGQSCSVSGGKGTVVTGDVSSVVVNCLANSYTVGGTVTGLAGALVLQNNGGNDRLLTANGSFAFSTPIANGSGYAVTVKTHPTSPVDQTCAVTQGTGTVGASDVTSVKVDCTTNRYTVGGTVSGLTGTVVLQNNGRNDTAITKNGGFVFSTSVASGSAYSVTALTQPFNQACQVTGGSGTIGRSNVDSAVVKCSTLVAFSENFDGVTAPALPAGWTSTISQGNVPWRTDTGAAASAPNGMRIVETIVAADVRLDSPAFTVGSSSAQLSFKNNWSMASRYGGGVLEISIDGAAFQDVIAAGGVFMSSPYTSALASTSGPIGSRLAWTGGGPGAFANTVVRLPAAAAGKSVRLRWRFVTSFYLSDKTWHIDDIVVRN